MDKLKISIDSGLRRALNRFVHAPVGAELGDILSLDGINIPQAIQDESDKNDQAIVEAAKKGKTANNYRVYLDNLD
ncbi:MAG: hypothetical protein WAV41_01595 [Microgenomates group bacterium]